jgi:phosphate butyryltransferase
LLLYVNGAGAFTFAALAPIETVNPKLMATVTAAVLAQMSVRHQFGKFLQVTGPLDIDCVLSKVAAQRKGVENKKSGNFDL